MGGEGDRELVPCRVLGAGVMVLGAEGTAQGTAGVCSHPHTLSQQLLSQWGQALWPEPAQGPLPTGSHTECAGPGSNWPPLAPDNNAQAVGLMLITQEDWHLCSALIS